MQPLHLLNKVMDYLNERISLDDLDEWIVENLLAFVPPRKDTLSELAGRIQLWISELRRGDRVESEVRQLIQDYLSSQQTFILPIGPTRYSSSANTTLGDVIEVPGGLVSWSVSTRPSGAPAS
jgi:hypothetical protein